MPVSRPPRRPVAAGLALALLLLAGACTRAGSETTEPAAGGAAGAPTTATGAPPPEPDRLADPGVAPGACKTVTYTPPGDPDPMPGELCRPASDQRDAAVIVVHGGSGIGGSYANMRRWANRYLAEGYVTFLPEYHLFTVGGESPVFPHPERNMKAAAQYLRGVGNAIGIRKDRIALQGMSAGARIGAVAFVTPDDPWFAGRELYEGISDRIDAFIGFYHPYDGTMQFADQYFGGNDFSKDPAVAERLAKADALSSAGQAPGPVLLVVGDKDWSIIVDQDEEFAAAVRARGYEARTVVVAGGGHGFDEGGNRLSKLGEQSAVASLGFLNDVFPQNPPRPPQVAPIDLNVLPNDTGAPATTVPMRPRPAARPKVATGGMGPVTPSPTTTVYAPTTAGPSTTAAAPTTAAPTTAVPTTKPVTTAPPTTAAPTTSPPTTSGGDGTP